MFDNYVGQLLISMPNLNDPFFKKTVILICEFNEKSVLGLILNKPIVDIKFDSLLKNLKIFGDNKLIDHQIYLGGPVYTNQGFIIHSTDKEYEDTQIIIFNNDKIRHDLWEDCIALSGIDKVKLTPFHGKA